MYSLFSSKINKNGNQIKKIINKIVKLDFERRKKTEITNQLGNGEKN